MSRVVEVYTGAYASGKSEISINRAVMLSEEQPITLVDLDTVEPAYTLRPIKKEVEDLGDIRVITQEDYFGLGEAGNTITPHQMNCLSNNGNIVIDVGYGAGGLDILDVINGINQEEDLRIYIVINTSKPETHSVQAVIDYIEFSKGSGESGWKKLSGIISNTHLSNETIKEDVLRGYKIVKEVSEKINLPIIAVTISEDLATEFSDDEFGDTPIWKLKRHMQKALW